MRRTAPHPLETSGGQNECSLCAAIAIPARQRSVLRGIGLASRLSFRCSINLSNQFFLPRFLGDGSGHLLRLIAAQNGLGLAVFVLELEGVVYQVLLGHIGLRWAQSALCQATVMTTKASASK